jgi:two-component system, cell cycle sensor histidine kinase and response regulator CckA
VATFASSAVKPALAPLRVLLVGNKEEDFFLIREILQRMRSRLAAELDHVLSLEEAKALLRRTPYGLILFQHETNNVEALRMLADFLHGDVSIPFIVLTEDADEHSVAEIIDSEQWNYLTRSQLHGTTLIRNMRNTLALHSLRQEHQTSEVSLRKLSRAVEQSADTVIITDRSGIIEYVNPAFEFVTGYNRGEAVGMTPAILKSGEQAQEIYKELWKTITAGKIWRGILINRKKSGELYYVEESISPVRDQSGAVTHFIANGRDVTERVRLEAQLLQAQKMDAIGRLAGGVAHDFNNLLTIITSYSELALDEIPKESNAAPKINEILQAARRAAELTRQLLAFSRKQPRALRVADLNQVIAGIAKTLPRLIGEDIMFRFNAGEEMGRVRVDPVQIEQVLLNLASNARDAMPHGGHLSVETFDVQLDEKYADSKHAIIPLGRYAMIKVSDDGIGIAPEHLPHIFEPFYTTKTTAKGTGLGLATAYGIVKQNGGFIWAYSEPNMGTVFKIYLPCVNEAGRVPSAEVVKTHLEPCGKETILLVEDEQAVRKATAEYLGNQGYTILEARNGLDALAVVGDYRAPIDLVVTDVVMPNMSGGELAKELAHLRPQTRLIFVSGYAGKTVLDHEVVDLETNFLEKPYTLKQLSTKIREALQRNESPAAGAACP